MKKNILSVLLMLFAASAMAQEIDCGYRWYVQAHINGSYSANEDLRQLSVGDALGWGGDLSVGYNFNDFWGMNLEVAYNKNKGAYNIESKREGSKPYSFNSIEPTLNVTYNLSNGFLGYKPGRKNVWYLHAGFGAAFTSGNTAPDEYNKRTDFTNANQTAFFGKLGINYVHHFNNWVAFTADLTGNILDDKFNGGVWQEPVDGRLNLGAGIRVYLTKGKKASREIVYRDEIVTEHDTIRVREEVIINEQDVYPIFFETNKSDIASAKTEDLAKVAEVLKANPQKVVYVLGYAEKENESADAEKLAANRAEVISSELINKYGIDEGRVITHKIGTQAQPYVKQADKNRSTICIITDLKHY